MVLLVKLFGPFSDSRYIVFSSDGIFWEERLYVKESNRNLKMI